jgi:dTDP-4-dehydrorhamnose reductase
MKRFYIAGSGGMLGEAFHLVLSGSELCCSDINANENWISCLDFRDRDRYMHHVFKFGPDALLHIGAHTDLEFCEENWGDAWATNVTAVETAVQIANSIDIPLVYISTAGIFDGKKDFYDDWDVPNPNSVYAQTKYAGERYVLENARRFLVCRAGWMMGGGPQKDKKFVSKIIHQLNQGCTALSVVNDKFGAPTYTHDFARGVNTLLSGELWGLYNMTNQGSASRLDVAHEILATFGLSDRVLIREVSSEYFQDVYSAYRPRSEVLINRKLASLGLELMRDWREALNDYLKSYYREYLPR